VCCSRFGNGLLRGGEALLECAKSTNDCHGQFHVAVGDNRLYNTNLDFDIVQLGVNLIDTFEFHDNVKWLNEQYTLTRLMGHRIDLALACIQLKQMQRNALSLTDHVRIDSSIAQMHHKHVIRTSSILQY